jgi:hypothetical protein
MYMWVLYACVCAGVEGSRAFACPFARVCFRACVCMRMRACACVSSCKMRACVCASVRACLVYVREREFAWVLAHTGVCACPCVLVVCVRVRACGALPWLCVRDVLTLTLTPRVRVCVLPRWTLIRKLSSLHPTMAWLSRGA